ncbi:serine/threonine-protein kinase [Nocardia nepalensis]|uniref:serine/threonine-protein kinase n=1 Tax=Nocardia nepalensis TaxID=3375448 RepID=UPI003B67ECA1
MVSRLEPGDPVRVGRYRLLGQLGAGGMGRVLLGIGPDGRLVAIKQVHAHLATEDDFLPRFRREVQTSARVSGAFTAAVIDFNVDSENPWLASVFVPGVPLDKAVHDFGPLSMDQLRTLAVGLATALHAIHGVGLIHRDLKPANVILAEDGPRVIDFGIARATEERSELTHTGSIIGSPAFMSPEQAQSEPLTPASDVFSFGAVLAMAAAGKSPFAGSSLPHTLYNIVHTQPDLSELPPELRQLVEPCLRKEAPARPTLAQILDFLGPLPPRAHPWSAAIHNAVHEQSAELSALLADPEATQIVGADDTTSPGPRGPSFDEKLRQLEAASRSDPPKRKRALVAALAGVVILVGAAVTGTVAFTGGDPTPDVSNPLAGFNLTKLRSIDVCAAMRDPLVGSLGDWSRKPTAEQWSTCAAEADGYRFEVGIDKLNGYRDNGGRAAAVPVLQDVTTKDNGCGRALMPAVTDPQFGITVRIKGDQPESKLCEVADSAVGRLAERMRNGPPLLADIRKSLARLDPCSLVAPVDIKFQVGPKVPGTLEQVHSCKWFGTNALTVRLERAKDFVDPPRSLPFEGSGGRVIYVGEDELTASTCVRRFKYRPLESDYVEVVTVQADNSSGTHPEGKCLAAQQVLDNIIKDLPGVG